MRWQRRLKSYFSEDQALFLETRTRHGSRFSASPPRFGVSRSRRDRRDDVVVSCRSKIGPDGHLAVLHGRLHLYRVCSLGVLAVFRQAEYFARGYENRVVASSLGDREVLVEGSRFHNLNREGSDIRRFA